ncbi:peroxiredoxin family protein [Larkinella rosea]|uniref:Thioredoxin domain-containing protein n=1 Tax=Larkinella rosea TaxID=2025312 RepID=A0A3P1BDJ2_9BACT|nr:redoxin domain-containing protein [Larkinella rosea]RRA99170.1 hypothetical protein EHT25_29835 [Larkinella rosea]
MRYPFLFILSICIYHASLAQPITIEQTGIRQEMRINENTVIFDKATGKRISDQQYRRLTKDDPFGYHLERVYDEYGQTSAYKIRPATPEERETHSFRPTAEGRPKVGETIPLFVMKGLDGKVYRSTDLQGRVVVLSFWISLKKPFWGVNQAKSYADILKPYQSDTGPVSLGIFAESKESLDEFMARESLPFIPIPDSYGFNGKFHVTNMPAFIVIDRTGKVAAYMDGPDYEELKNVLQKISK